MDKRYILGPSIAFLTVAVLLSGCSHRVIHKLPVASAATTTAPAKISKVDLALEDTVRAGGSVRALVTVQNVAVQLGPVVIIPGVLPGPYMTAKVAALSSGGAGVTLVQDYSAMPLMLVTITSTDALNRLAASNTVTRIDHEQQNTISS